MVDPPSQRSATERTGDVADAVRATYRHLALVAVDGATDEVAATLSPDFTLRIGGLVTDRWGYLSLIAGRWACEGPRPPLHATRHVVGPGDVSVLLDSGTIAHFQVRSSLIRTLRLTMPPSGQHDRR